MDRQLFESLFDLSFSEFVTIRIVKFLFVLGLLIAGAYTLFVGVAMLMQGGLTALFSLVLMPLMFFVCVLGLRVYLEIIIVLFKIAENTSIMAGRAGGSDSAQGSA